MPYAADRSSREQLICPVDGCEKTFDRKARLERHHITSHLNLRDYKCTECDDAYGRKDHLKRHMESKHGIASYKPFQCTEEGCEERFFTKQKLQRHQNSHRLKCRICEAKFKKSDSYETHMKFHNGEQVPCPYKDRNKCVSTFYDEKLYGLHVRKCKALYNSDRAQAKEAKENKPASKSSSSPAQKPVLPQKTSDSVMVPKELFPCQVELCGKSYTSKYNLKAHVSSVHKNERPHKCPCGAAFATKSVFTTHKQRHKVENGKRNYDKPLITPLKLGEKRSRPESDEKSIVPYEGPKKRRVKNPPLVYTSRRKSRNPEVEHRKSMFSAAIPM